MVSTTRRSVCVEAVDKNVQLGADAEMRVTVTGGDAGWTLRCKGNGAFQPGVVATAAGGNNNSFTVRGVRGARMQDVKEELEFELLGGGQTLTTRVQLAAGYYAGELLTRRDQVRVMFIGASQSGKSNSANMLATALAADGRVRRPVATGPRGERGQLPELRRIPLPPSSITLLECNMDFEAPTWATDIRNVLDGVCPPESSFSQQRIQQMSGQEQTEWKKTAHQRRVDGVVCRVPISASRIRSRD